MRQQESLVLYESFITPLGGGGEEVALPSQSLQNAKLSVQSSEISPPSPPPQATMQAIKSTFWPVFYNTNFVQF